MTADNEIARMCEAGHRRDEPDIFRAGPCFERGGADKFVVGTFYKIPPPTDGQTARVAAVTDRTSVVPRRAQNVTARTDDRPGGRRLRRRVSVAACVVMHARGAADYGVIVSTTGIVADFPGLANSMMSISPT